MESFVAESFVIVEPDNALSYWEFINGSDAVDSDSDFEVSSFDDLVASLHSSVSASASLSHSGGQSLHLAGPIEAEEAKEDRDRDCEDRGSVRVDDQRVVHETLIASQDLGLSFNVNLVHDDVIDDRYDPRSFGYGSMLGFYENGYANHRSYVCEDENDEEEYDDDDDDQDLDDELVPWSVSGKFERQRMRKLGKRAFAKMSNSKKAPHTHVKPGCLHGKHGLGVKHNI